MILSRLEVLEGRVVNRASRFAPTFLMAVYNNISDNGVSEIALRASRGATREVSRPSIAAWKILCARLAALAPTEIHLASFSGSQKHTAPAYIGSVVGACCEILGSFSRRYTLVNVISKASAAVPISWIHIASMV